MRRPPGTQSQLRMRRPLRNPVIWDGLDSVGVVRCRQRMAGQRRHRRRADDRGNVFPDDRAVGGDLEESAVDALVDQGVAVGQALRRADEWAVELPVGLARGARRILPDDGLLDGVDLDDPRAADDLHWNWRKASLALIIEDQNIASAGPARGDHINVVRTADLVER